MRIPMKRRKRTDCSSDTMKDLSLDCGCLLIRLLRPLGIRAQAKPRRFDGIATAIKSREYRASLQGLFEQRFRVRHSIHSRTQMKILCLTLLVGGIPAMAPACDLCSLYSTSPSSSTEPGIFAGVSEQFTHFGTLQDNGVRVDNEVGQYLDSSVSHVFVGYTISPRASVQFNLPVIYREFSRPRGSVIDSGVESGIGDASLTGTLSVLRTKSGDFSLNWELLGGVKFPTGDSSRLAEEEIVNDPPLPPSGIGGHDLALGSGSFDGIFGSTIVASWGRCFGSGSFQYTLRSEGDFHHQHADDVMWWAGPGYRVYERDSSRLSLQLVVSGDTKDKDTMDGETDGDSAASAIYLGPQVEVGWRRFISVFAVDVPVSVRNSGLQVVPDYRLRLSLLWRF